MTRQPDCTVSDDLMRMIAEQGLDALTELIRIMLNAAMQAERQQYLRAAPYERTSERQGYANGYKPNTVTTRVGDITFASRKCAMAAFIPRRSNAVCAVNVH